ncbi:hypothetical protein NL676_011752 [Syzygium grande]|nr:hypothetical protein NL676_011752 [Syzygium grande]
MDWNQETLQFLSQCFLHTLSPPRPSPPGRVLPRRRRRPPQLRPRRPPPRRRALRRRADPPGRRRQLQEPPPRPLGPSPTPHDDAAAAAADADADAAAGPASSSAPISDAEKEQIKALIVPLMLSSSARIQSQLSEALAVISKHDFPKLWPALLPDLVSNLQKASRTSDYASINGILGTANSIFEKFLYQYKTNDLLLDLKYCLDNFAAPLLEIFLRTAKLIDETSSSGHAVNLRPLFESQRLCCRIFYSLNVQELPEFFEDHMAEWMGEFQKYLTTRYPALEGSGPDGLAHVDELRAAVCENISLYMEKNEDEFKGYLDKFASAVWEFTWGREGVIQQICQSIVIPNVRLREEDEELFEMNYVEFIRRDMEGSDLDTRRRIACELLKGIATYHKAEVTAIVSAQIQNLLTSFAANPAANWKDKDCAIYLVVSLATKKAGGNAVSTDVVNIESFFMSVIVPELQSQNVNEFPMLKAGALKFFTLFRSQIAKGITLQLFPDLVRFLSSESNVVHSYAASCIEKLLLVKDEVAVLVRRACEKDASLISSFEGSLFPSLQTILANDVTEFFPYAFQLLAQLVELNRPPIPANYMPIFEILLSPDLWNRGPNVPALVRLLQAFLQKSPHELSQGGRLSQLTAVASTRLLCESPLLLDAAASRHWGKMLDSIMTLLSRPEEDTLVEEPDAPDVAENVGYTATFVNLRHAGRKEEDPLKDIREPREFVQTRMHYFSSAALITALLFEKI